MVAQKVGSSPLEAYSAENMPSTPETSMPIPGLKTSPMTSAKATANADVNAKKPRVTTPTFPAEELLPSPAAPENQSNRNQWDNQHLD